METSQAGEPQAERGDEASGDAAPDRRPVTTTLTPGELRKALQFFETQEDTHTRTTGRRAVIVAPSVEVAPPAPPTPPAAGVGAETRRVAIIPGAATPTGKQVAVKRARPPQRVAARSGNRGLTPLHRWRVRRPLLARLTLAAMPVALALLLALVVVGAARTPLGGALPNGARIYATPSIPPWQSATADLGAGGGHGPGVVAYGSANVPITNLTPVLSIEPPTPTPTPLPTATPIPAPQVSQPQQSSSGAASAPSGALAEWTAVPGYPSYAVGGPFGFHSSAWGQCTWWAAWKRQDENLAGLGNAWQWAGAAAGRGMSVGSWPAVGSTAVFQPGVYGASGLGHVAHVEAVYGGGWFLMSEMNFYWNGGGFGRVDYRYAHTQAGLSFIY